MFGQKFIEIHEYTRVTSDLVYSRNDIKRPKPDPVAFPSTRPFEDVLSMDKPKALEGGNRSRNFRCFARNFPWLETDSVAIQFRGKKVGTAVTVESVLLFASLLRSMIVYIYIYIRRGIERWEGGLTKGEGSKFRESGKLDDDRGSRTRGARSWRGSGLFSTIWFRKRHFSLRWAPQCRGDCTATLWESDVDAWRLFNVENWSDMPEAEQRAPSSLSVLLSSPVIFHLYRDIAWKI